MKNDTNRLNRNLLLGGLVLLVYLCFVAGIGSGPLFDVDEGAFSEATREMLVSKNYLTTYLNGALRFDKPILIYWLQLLSIKSFGINEFAFRLPSAIAAALWALTLFLFVRRERNETEAVWATALMALSLQVSIIAKAAIADSMLNLCLAVTLLSIYRYWRHGERPAIYLAFAAIGFGMLDKGPVAILIPVVVSFLFFAVQKDLKRWFRLAFNPLGIALFLAIAMPWYLLEYREQGQAFINGFIMKHNIGRFKGSMEGHSGSLLYYIPVVLIGLLPSTGLFFRLFTKLRSRLNDPLWQFCLIWFAFVFAFFSLSGTKLPHYMIYGYTPLFILLGSELAEVESTWLHALWPTALLLMFAALPLVLPQVIPSIESRFVQAQLQGLLAAMAANHFSLLMSVAAAVCLLLQFAPMMPPLRFIIGGALLTLSFNFAAMPMAASVMQRPVKEAALLARREGLKIVMWKVYYPSFLVYSGSFAERRAPRPGDVVLTTIDRLDRLGPVEQLYGKHGIVLVRMPDQPETR